ncbi:Glycolipid 2-alpha-mannosyltransferase 2 [Sparassis crispa]|uniref:Glycolipid 2-alpha-mannosyltransferase 2 n=1 Tax=Sparassis crispa TaxID=139825 RepID=A0A401GV06_9APHY|nr:Glycolipid 2-alpha-mannosyltransferase 2 [Sparassis crispa]GBE86019.1 Glycolipid 2-alpha-mannosyltransferase 2 [Sparassis crispa]
MPASMRRFAPNRTTRYVLLVAFLITTFYLSFSLTQKIYSRESSTLASKTDAAVVMSPPPSVLPIFFETRATSESISVASSTSSISSDVLSASSSSLPSSSFSSSSYLSSPSPSPSPTPTPIPVEEPAPEAPRRANATLLMLSRNSELDKAAASVRELEDKFNRQFAYPWVFLNEVPFSDQFIARMTELASGPVYFGQIPPHHWYQPAEIDENRAETGRNEMVEEDIIYGGSVSYRNMCRFNSGFFYRHPLLQQFRWYWRVEPDVHFHCVTDEDPFLYMEDNDKHYGFTISLLEFEKTIETLWETTKEFIAENPQYVAPNNSMAFLSNDGGETYNLCHFWSNFEIADMDFWRGEAYEKYFRYLDSKGGFYYERWGDAPVHSIAASLFLRKDQIHFFDEIGYEHHPFTHCPHGPGLHRKKRCTCRGWRSFDYQGYSCLKQWERIHP